MVAELVEMIGRDTKGVVPSVSRSSLVANCDVMWFVTACQTHSKISGLEIA